jgi:hypothetical protein
MIFGITQRILRESMGFQWALSVPTHAITPDQKGNPIDVLAVNIFLTGSAYCRACLGKIR